MIRHSGCGSVGRTVASDTIGPRLESKHRSKLYLPTINSIENTKIIHKNLKHLLGKFSVWEGFNKPHLICKNYQLLKHSYRGGSHSSVVLSAPTILRPQARIPSTPSMLFSICIEIITRKEQKNKKRPGLALFKKHSY